MSLDFNNATAARYLNKILEFQQKPVHACYAVVSLDFKVPMQ